MYRMNVLKVTCAQIKSLIKTSFKSVTNTLRVNTIIVVKDAKNVFWKLIASNAGDV